MAVLFEVVVVVVVVVGGEVVNEGPMHDGTVVAWVVLGDNEDGHEDDEVVVDLDNDVMWVNDLLDAVISWVVHCLEVVDEQSFPWVVDVVVFVVGGVDVIGFDLVVVVA